jgi:antibiotic biosynthesis monooxygenase (ABM) superfamily enzyme
VSGTASAEHTTSRGPATVIIGQRVKTGLATEFRQWQDSLNAAAATYPGYLGTEVTPPTDEQGEWTVIYRFGTVGHLHDWLNSTTRHEILERGHHLFEATATQQVVVGAGDAALATVVVSHPVKPELEREFLDWQQRVTEAEQRFPGFSGAELFRPVPGVQEDWTAIYRFASTGDLERWLGSTERRQLLREGEHFQDFNLRKITSSFGNWFSFAGDDAASVAPPSWKTALSVLVGLYPLVVVLTIAISEIWKSASLWQSLLLGNILSVSMLTWVVMPIVTRALRFWLAPDEDAKQPQTDLIGLVACTAFLAVAALVFWLVTVQVWKLP